MTTKGSQKHPTRARAGARTQTAGKGTKMLRYERVPAANDTYGLPCGCELTLKFLASEGGKHARSALAHGAADVLHFSKNDWFLHMEEEERILRQMVFEGRFPRASFERIFYEHDEIRDQLQRTGRVDAVFARAHAKFEDQQVAAAGLMR